MKEEKKNHDCCCLLLILLCILITILTFAGNFAIYDGYDTWSEGTTEEKR